MGETENRRYGVGWWCAWGLASLVAYVAASGPILAIHTRTARGLPTPIWRAIDWAYTPVWHIANYGPSPFVEPLAAYIDWCEGP